MDCEYILKIQRSEFAEKFYVWCKRRQRVKKNPEFLARANGRIELLFTEMGKVVRNRCAGRDQWQNSSEKDQIVNILSFACQKVSFATTQLCSFSRKQP